MQRLKLLCRVVVTKFSLLSRLRVPEPGNEPSPPKPISALHCGRAFNSESTSSDVAKNRDDACRSQAHRWLTVHLEAFGDCRLHPELIARFAMNQLGNGKVLARPERLCLHSVEFSSSGTNCCREANVCHARVTVSTEDLWKYGRKALAVVADDSFVGR